MTYFMGIDIGSTSVKGVIIKSGRLLAEHQLPSGADYRAAAVGLSSQLLERAGLTSQQIAGTVITGHNVTGLAFASKRAADIRCCARGISRLFPEARTVIDIQAMSSRVIQLSDAGRVINFVTSEKCAAGSGRFLEIVANILKVDIKEIGRLSLKSRRPISFTTNCAVFGEAEVISRVAEGAAVADILAGTHRALANKLATLIGRLGLEPSCAISGGGGLDEGLRHSLEERLGVTLLMPERPRLVTALGAAIMAQEMAA